MKANDLLDCGHPPDAGHPATVDGKTVQGWQFVLTDDGKKICHACADKIVLDCGHTPSPHEAFSTGYGVDSKGKKSCYACCAEADKTRMIEDGKIVLYLSHDAAPQISSDYWVANWPGSLKFRVSYRKVSRHNMARTRDDVWFTGPDGKNWHGVQYGRNSQLCYCKRIKS